MGSWAVLQGWAERILLWSASLWIDKMHRQSGMGRSYMAFGSFFSWHIKNWFYSWHDLNTFFQSFVHIKCKCKEESLPVVIWTRFLGQEKWDFVVIVVVLICIFQPYVNCFANTLISGTNVTVFSNFWLICPHVTHGGFKPPSSNPRWPCDIFSAFLI